MIQHFLYSNFNGILVETMVIMVIIIIIIFFAKMLTKMFPHIIVLFLQTSAQIHLEYWLNLVNLLLNTLMLVRGLSFG